VIKRLILAFGLPILLIVLAFVSGPMVGWSPALTTSEVRTVEGLTSALELDRYLVESESHVLKLKPDLARGIVWFDSTKRDKTPISIVYIHGFTASRREMFPVWDRIAKELGANLYYARVKGHGLEDGEELGQITAQDFIDEGRVALAIGRKIGEKVILAGMSTGAPIIETLANENRDTGDIQALVFISPNHTPAIPGARFVSGPFGPMWARLILGTHRSFNTINDLHAKYWTPRYRSEAIPAMMDLVNSALRIDLGAIEVPTLTLYTSKDKVVDVSLIEKRHAEIGAKKKKIINLPEASRHELAGDAVAPEAVDAAVKTVLEFLQSN